LEQRRGLDARDGVWSHPDLLPNADDLDDPASWVERSATEETFDISKLDDSDPG
jgi:uncharacterized protein (DUF2342 family)